MPITTASSGGRRGYASALPCRASSRRPDWPPPTSWPRRLSSWASGSRPWARIWDALRGRLSSAPLADYGELRARYEVYGAEEARDRASRLLDRLGLEGAGEREAALLSGGEKNVLSLASALMGEPELLILDEPGNHLDFAGLAWLEEFVASERRAILMVSHNRWLLDRAVGSILELEGRRITRYSGGFSSYRIEKLKAASGQGREYEADRKRIERLEALVRKFADIARSRPDPRLGKAPPRQAQPTRA